MLQFRLADEQDLPIIRVVVDLAFSPFIPLVGKQPVPMLEDFMKAIRDDEIWLAESSGVCKGLLHLKFAPSHLVYEIVAVSPLWQGQGVGKALLRFGEEKAKEYGYQEIRLLTNQTFSAAVAMYPKYGYQEVERREEEGYSRIYYRKAISTP